MFGIFKNNKVEKFEVDLLVNIFKRLPPEFHAFEDQIKDGLLNRRFPQKDDSKNYIGFSYNGQLSKKYETKTGRYFKLTNIQVYEIKSAQFILIEIFMHSGLVIGYATPTTAKPKLDVDRINISEYKTEFLDEKNEDFKKLAKLLNEDEVKLLDPSEVYSVEFDSKLYYHVKELENGDFLGIDEDGNIYRITHDPYEIKLLHDPISKVLKAY
ncbi:hypothetical protein RAH57_03565 [Chryseobacterium sp. CKR4-1]|uniref:hypothetical protein n=1 Tax=Chryseobacterium sp. CKR4-1 TaxID=3068896 RepID=UPI002796A651|nr:hypothetical protein [Chryseobacterium sp. CKR4-1]MDQ1803049.1 hypothetical protein [Chryseobacterium sp. CKR4-1]